MRAVDFLREHLISRGWGSAMPISRRREIVNAAKKARKRGQNPAVVVARLCQESGSAARERDNS